MMKIILNFRISNHLLSQKAEILSIDNIFATRESPKQLNEQQPEREDLYRFQESVFQYRKTSQRIGDRPRSNTPMLLIFTGISH